MEPELRDPAERSFRVALLTSGDARDPRLWSGTPVNMARAVERRLGPVHHLGPMPAWLRIAPKIPERIRTALGARTKGLPQHSALAARLYGPIADRRLARLDPPADLVLSPAGSALIPHMRSRLPVVYSSDATARLMFDYYPQFSGVSEGARAAADELERRTVARADLLLYPTRWAADSAVADYGADPGRIRVAPYGANLGEIPEPAPAAAPAPGEPCRLLMVGVNWAIKGGRIAVDALQALRARGVAAELDVVGCAPPEPIGTPGLRITPFLDKNDPADRARLGAFYQAAHFLILPTRCECFGIVFCEASAYGVPSVATRTGGVPEVVREGENGHTLPFEAGGEAYAARIAALWSDPAGYAALRASSRRAFETRLNWDAWGDDAAEAIRSLMAGRGAPRLGARSGSTPSKAG